VQIADCELRNPKSEIPIMPYALRTAPYALRLVLYALLLSSCLMPGDAAPVVKIGLIAPFEGLGRPLGYAVLPAVKTALAEANASGQLGRYRVVLVALNDDLEPRAATAQARALAQDGEVLAVLGPWSEATAAAAAPVLAQAGMPALVAAGMKTPADGVYSLCPAPDAIFTVLEAEAHRLVASGVAVRVHTGDAAAAADDLVRWRAEGWGGVLLGSPDLVRPWLVQRAGAAAEGTRAIVCVLSGMQEDGGDGALAEAGTRLLLQALADDIAAHGRPTREGVAAALARQPIQLTLAWYQVEGGSWSWQGRF
jgi:hypothetical protein